MACSISLALASSVFSASTFSSNSGEKSWTSLTRIWMPSAATASAISFRTFLSATRQDRAGRPGSGRGRRNADLAQPAEVGLIGQGTLVRQQHVHGLAEPAKRQVELGADVLGLQHPHTGIEVIRVGRPTGRTASLRHAGSRAGGVRPRSVSALPGCPSLENTASASLELRTDTPQ